MLSSMSCFRLIGAVSLCLIVLLAAGPATGGDKAKSKRHFKSGVSLLQNDKYNAAAAEFEISVELHATKSGIYNLANCYRALHQYDKALAAFHRLSEEYKDELDAEMRDDVERQLSEIRDIVAMIKIKTDQPGATVSIDGRDMGVIPPDEKVILSPGTHEIVVSLDGYETETRTVVLDSGARKKISFKLKPIEDSPGDAPVEPIVEPSGPTSVSHEEDEKDEIQLESTEEELTAGKEEEDGKSPLFVVGLVGTLVAGGLSGVFWGLGASRKGDYENRLSQYDEVVEDWNPFYPDENEPSVYKKIKSARDEASLYNKLAISATVITGAMAATMIVGLVVSPGSDEESAVEVAAAPGGLMLRF
ncbi:MAG: PEGA domain-containing protein [Deltaproteobacteria bacterium]|nr:PEGA domain-containing protein [Deltaproteobacteria bacterium]